MDTKSGIGSGIRSVSKSVIKAGMVVGGGLADFAAETGGGLKALLAEARAELAQPAKPVKTVSHEGVTNEKPGVMSSMYDHLIRTRDVVWDEASKLMTMANAGLVAAVAWFAGESTEKARKQVDRAEKAVEKVGRELTQEEAAQVIEAVIVAAV